MTADPLSPAAVAAAAKFLSPASPPAIPSAALASAPAMRGRAASWTGEEQAQRQEAAAAAAAEEAQQRERSASSFGRALRTLSSRLTPTNYNMLLFRTLNRDLCLPNANDDYIAPLFRDRLMPVRSWVQRSVPGMAAVTRRGVEDPAVGVPGVCNFVDARTKWLDGAVRQALDEGVTQVVCIAAGYDTRAYRFYRPGVKFFEVDLPSASKKKQELVRSVLPGAETLPRPVYIAADLGRVTLAAALEGSGFDRSRRTLFTCEGLVYYLPEAAVATLLASVADIAAPGSRILFDFLHADAVDRSAFYPGYAACADSVAGKGEAFVSGLVPQAAELAAYLAPLGWALGVLRGPREMAARELPHAGWGPGLPPILTFYSYCEAEKAGAEARCCPEDQEEEEGGSASPDSVIEERLTGGGDEAVAAAALQRELSLIQALAAADLS